MILRAGGHIVFSKHREKPFKLLLAWQGRRKLSDVSAITLKPGAVTVLRVQRKMLPPDDLGHSLLGLFGLPRAILIHEQLFVY